MGKMDKEDLELKEELAEFTPLALACLDGFIEIAECMIKKNPGLACIANENGSLPVLLAAMRGKKEMTRYLYTVTPPEELAPEKGRNGASLVSTCIVKQMLGKKETITSRRCLFSWLFAKNNLLLTFNLFVF